ncbi:MAG: hypothetical protein JNL28_12030 [Planctomycetes bacterium]|nr:hypothetical protein [Planctomycetota bacterium]
MPSRKSRHFNALWSRVRGLVGAEVTPVSEDVALEAAALPSYEELQTGCAELPAQYADLFLRERSGPEVSIKLQQSNLKTLDDALLAWLGGMPTTLALIGPSGSGLGSTLAAFATDVESRGLRATTVVPQARVDSAAALIAQLVDALSLPPAIASLDELVDELVRDQQRVVLIEDAQRWFVRRMGVRAALATLVELILRTRRRCLWVVSAGSLAWSRLDALGGLSSVMSEVIECETPDADELRAIVLTRHSLSGLELHVAGGPDKPPLLPPTPEYEKALAEYFSKLHTLCGGHPTTAIYYWRMSVEASESDQALMLTRCPRLVLGDIGSIATLPRLILAELSVHGGLVIDYVADIFPVSTDEARQYLERLRRSGLVERDDDGEYTLNPLVGPHVYPALSRAHLLY